MPRKGENIYKRKDGRWEGRYIRSRDQLSGAIQYGYIYGKTYSDVKKRKASAEREKYKPINRHMTIAECMEEYLQEKASDPNLHRSTLERYRQAVQTHILPSLGSVKLQRLDERVLAGFRREKLEHGRLDGTGGLSPASVRTLLTLLNAMQRYAHAHGYLSAVSAAQVNRPRGNRNERLRILSRKEQASIEQHLLDCMRKNQRKAGVYLGILTALYTGLRVGELSALQWRDIDFEQGCIYVQRTLQRLYSEDSPAKTELYISRPKSAASQRSVPLVSGLAAILEQYRNALPKEWQESKRPVFSVDGRYCEPRLFQLRFKSLLREAEIADMNFHALRHTFATRCAENNMDVKTLSEILGHENPSLTLKRYTHSLDQQKRKCMERLTFLGV